MLTQAVIAIVRIANERIVFLIDVIVDADIELIGVIRSAVNRAKRFKRGVHRLRAENPLLVCMFITAKEK